MSQPVPAADPRRKGEYTSKGETSTQFEVLGGLTRITHPKGSVQTQRAQLIHLPSGDIRQRGLCRTRKLSKFLSISTKKHVVLLLVYGDVRRVID